MKNEDLERVSENFLNPMMELYSKKLNQYQVQAYVEDLSVFPNEILLGAVAQIRRTSKYFPNIAECIATCEKLQAANKPKQNPVVNEMKNPLDDARKMASDYTETFMKSVTGFEAEAGGYYLSLWAYVLAVATVQAQMILGMKNIGWSSVDIFGFDQNEENDVKGFFARQREQAQMNFIEVSIPANKIKIWRERAQKKATA